MRIYTRTGDGGDTGLFDGTRVPKEDLRVQAYGDVDELGCLLGLVRSEEAGADTAAGLERIQEDLFEVGSDLATPGGTRTEAFLAERIQDLERWIDEVMGGLPALRSFVLPGGSRPGALCHLARAVCRRAERSCWAARRVHPFPDRILVYLNRLSDLLFALARAANARAGAGDTEWKPRA